ncbi:MAG: hypothetical protein Q7J78_00880, partial [Clostridiales bacterium]|nr:hypothetical protein [Clostridiales bacterium]
MKNAIVKKLLCLVLCLMMMVSILAACGGVTKTEGGKDAAIVEQTNQPEASTQSKQEPVLEYSVYDVLSDSSQKWYDNPKDVVTPFIEQKFNIKVSKIMYNQGITFQERFNMLLASNDLPDVIVGAMTDSYGLAAKSGKYAEAIDLMKQYMPNFMKYANGNEWKDSLVNGKLYGIPQLQLDTSKEEYASDLYSSPPPDFCLSVREDILKQCGYSFKSMADLEKQIYDTQKKPTVADFELTPSIKTPNDFYQLLKKIKDLKLKVGDQTIIPLDMPWWAQHHLGSVFGCNTYWRYEPKTGEVSHSLGGPAAKDFYMLLNKMFKEGLINKDFLIDKDAQTQEKFASGKVAVSLWVPDFAAAQTALISANPEAITRPVQVPHFEGVTYAGIDH